MKMLKKAGALAIAGAMAMSLGTISAFADSAITLGTIEYTPATEESSIATFKVPYTAAAGVSQVTLLAELGAAEGVFANAIAYSTTAYIDQESADTYFEFKIDDSRLQLAEDQEKLFLNVKVGGTGVSTPATASLDITPVVEDESAVTKDMVIGAVDADLTGKYAADTVVARLDITELVNNATIDLTKETVKIGGVEAKYTLYNGVYKVIYVGAPINADTVVEVVPAENGMTRLYYGDANADGSVITADAIPLFNLALGTSVATDAYQSIALDMSGDGAIITADAIPLFNLALGTADSCAAAEK